MKASKIIFNENSLEGERAPEVQAIYIKGCRHEGVYSKEAVYRYLMRHPQSIQVDISPFPDLIPAVSKSGVRYVRSRPDRTGKDNLLDLPKL